MNHPWGDPEKIHAAMVFADSIITKIDEIEEKLGFKLFELENDHNKRRDFFLLLLNYIKQHHKHGSKYYEDMSYVMERIFNSVFGDNSTNVTKMFFKDGLFKDIRVLWNELA